MAKRIDIDVLLFGFAHLWALRSTCSRRQVGAVVADPSGTLTGRKGAILSHGYNGTLPGQPHCDHSCRCAGIHPERSGPAGHLHWPDCPAHPANRCTLAAHAEANAYDWAARRGTAIEGATLLTTATPCLTCARSTVSVGIAHVIYGETYTSEGFEAPGLALVRQAGIPTSHFALSRKDLAQYLDTFVPGLAD